MATGKFFPANVDEELVTFETETEQNPKTDAERKTDALLDALNDDPAAYLNVCRETGGGNSPMEFVGKYAADEYDFGSLQEHLQQRFGGGKYRIMLYAKGKIRANRLIKIADEITPKNGNSLNQDNTLVAVLERMDAMQRQMMELVREKTQQPSRTDFIREMMMYKEFFNAGNQNNGGSVISQMREMMELQRELSGTLLPQPEKEESGFGELLDKLTPLVTAAVNSTNQTRINPTQKTPEQKAKEESAFIIKAGLNQLLTAAKKNSDPATYAEMIIDQFPQPLITQLANSPNAITQINTLLPESKEYSAWFVDLIEHVKAQLGMPSKFEELYSDGDETIITGNDTEQGAGGDNLQANDDS